jgi:hypothetical protein
VATRAGRREERADRGIANIRTESVDSALCLGRQANARQLRRQRLVERIREVAGSRGFFEIFEELIRYCVVDEGEIDRRPGRLCTARRANRQGARRRPTAATTATCYRGPAMNPSQLLRRIAP